MWGRRHEHVDRTADVSQFDLEAQRDQGGLGQASRDYWDKVKGGDLGSLPAIFGALVLVIVFGVMQGDTFLTANNFANLINQGAAITVLAIGLVFVLLLGEIDLSAGFTAGTGAAILAVTLTEHDWAWPLAGARGARRRRGDRLRDRAAGRAPGNPELRRDARVLPRVCRARCC